MPDQTEQFYDAISAECSDIRDMLIEKNKKYGNSVLTPLSLFSKTDPLTQIDVRIDDKLSRIKQSADGDTEDAVMDLVGYLILKRAIQRMDSVEEGVEPTTGTEDLSWSMT